MNKSKDRKLNQRKKKLLLKWKYLKKGGGNLKKRQCLGKICKKGGFLLEGGCLKEGVQTPYTL